MVLQNLGSLRAKVRRAVERVHDDDDDARAARAWRGSGAVEGRLQRVAPHCRRRRLGRLALVQVAELGEKVHSVPANSEVGV